MSPSCKRLQGSPLGHVLSQRLTNLAGTKRGWPGLAPTDTVRGRGLHSYAIKMQGIHLEGNDGKPIGCCSTARHHWLER
jgi:hypothetical protein